MKNLQVSLQPPPDLKEVTQRSKDKMKTAYKIWQGGSCVLELTGQVIVNDIDTNLIGALLGIAEF